MKWKLSASLSAVIALAVGAAYAGTVPTYPSGGSLQSGDTTYIVRNGASMNATVGLGTSSIPGLLSCGSGTTCAGGQIVVSSSGITGTTGDVVCTGAPTATCALQSNNTARTNLGLGTSSSPTFAGLNLSGQGSINLNTTPLSSPLAGSVLQLGQANTTDGRAEIDTYGGTAHFTGVRKDGTASSPTTLQSGDDIASLNAWGYNGANVVGPQGAFRCFAAQNWGIGSNGTYCDVATTPIGGAMLTQVAQFNNDGGVVLGSPTGGDKGAATLNAAGGLWSNGTAVLTANQTITLSGDASGSGTTAITVANNKVNGVAYPASPSTNTVPVILSANNATYTALPSCSGGTNALGWQTNTGFICNTIAGGGAAALSAITAATGSNTIDNGANGQEWDWNALTTGVGMKHTSTGITTGTLLDVEANNTSGVSKAGFFTNTSTSAAFGVFGSETGASNAGYGVYGSNASFSGYGVYSNGVLGATTSATAGSQPVFSFINNGNNSATELGQILAPNLTGGSNRIAYVTIGVANATSNSFGLGFQYAGTGSNNNYGYMTVFSKGGFYVYGNGNVHVNPAASPPATAPTDSFSVAGDIAMTTTSAVVPTAGIYSAAASELDLTSTGAAQVKLTSTNLVELPNIATDSTHTDATVCEDTTTHALYFGSGTLGVCLGTSSARYKKDIVPMKAGLEQIEKLKAVNYFYKDGYGDNGAKQQYGFLAEDMADVIPGLVGLDKKGQPNSVDLVGLVPILVKAVQDQQHQIDDLKARLKAGH